MARLTTKAKTKREKDKIGNLRAFNFSYFHGKSHFEIDGALWNYLIFQQILKFFKFVANSSTIIDWKSFIIRSSQRLCR